MAETYSADIVIGGKITRANLEELFDAIERDGAFDEDGANLFEADWETWAPDGKPLRLCDPQAIWGHFSEIEAACQDLGLRYVRWSEDGDKQVFDGERTHDVTGDSDGRTVLDARRLRQFSSLEEALTWLDTMDGDPPALEIEEAGEQELPPTERPGFKAIVEAAYGAAREAGADLDDPKVIRLIGDWLDANPELKPGLLGFLAERVVAEKAAEDEG